MQKRAILLHNIRSAHNVGSIFRTADAAGVSEIVLSGYTPAPLDRFQRPQKEIAKTALGAEHSIPWMHVKNFPAALRYLKKEGYAIVGVEQDSRAVDYRTYVPKSPVAFVLGNEVRGLSKSLRDQCDVLVQIPMHGTKESLNVSVAAGIALFASLSN